MNKKEFKTYCTSLSSQLKQRAAMLKLHFDLPDYQQKLRELAQHDPKVAELLGKVDLDIIKACNELARHIDKRTEN